MLAVNPGRKQSSSEIEDKIKRIIVQKHPHVALGSVALGGFPLLSVFAWAGLRREPPGQKDVRATGRQLKGANPCHGLVGLSHRNPILCSEIALSRCSPKALGFFNRRMSSFPNAVLLSMIALICLQLSQDIFLAQSSPRVMCAGSGGSLLLAPPFPFPGDAKGAGTCCKVVSDVCQHLSQHVSPELLTWKAFGIALWQAKWTGRCGEANNAVKLCSPRLAGLTDALEAGSGGVWSWS